jgi:hypothetical protein
MTVILFQGLLVKFRSSYIYYRGRTYFSRERIINIIEPVDGK